MIIANVGAYHKFAIVIGVVSGIVMTSVTPRSDKSRTALSASTPVNATSNTHNLVFFFLCGFFDFFDYVRKTFIDFLKIIVKVVLGNNTVFFEFF